MTSKAASLWIPCLLLRCGDVESNPGPSATEGVKGGGEASMPKSRSRVSLSSIRSSIQRRRRELYIEPTPLWNSCRLMLAMMGFLGFLNVYAMRVNLSVAMVCMINQTAIQTAPTTLSPVPGHDINNSSSVGDGGVYNLSYVSGGVNGSASVREKNGGGDQDSETTKCGKQTGNSSLSANEDGEFTWSKETQGLILGSFFWGYMTTQIAGGWLAARIGGKRVYGWFMFGCSVCTLLMPLAARTDFRFLLVLRFLAGVGQGVTFPAMNVLWANWAPPLESSKLGSFSYSGSQVGNVLTFPLAGILCEYGFDGGWPSIFYLLGCLGLLWFVAWHFLVFDSPAEHPRISPEERSYITTSLKGKMAASRQTSGHVPVLTIMTSRPVWGIIITHTCSNFGTYTFLTNIPTYMKEVLHFDIKQNGLLSALPYIGFWLTIVLSGQLADIVRARGWLTTTQTRKVGNSLGMLAPGTFVVAVGYMTCEQSTTAVILLTLGVAMSGFQYGSGWMVNPVDIAPRYAGVIFGISNTFATVPGFVAPIVIGLITTNQTQAEWQVVFFIAAAIYLVAALAYILLGSGDLQPWARQPPPHDTAMSTKDGTADGRGPEEDSLLPDGRVSRPGAKLGKSTSVSFGEREAADPGPQAGSGSGSGQPENRLAPSVTGEEQREAGLGEGGGGPGGSRGTRGQVDEATSEREGAADEGSEETSRATRAEDFKFY